MNEKTLNNVELLPFFTKTALLAFESVKTEALNQNVKRWVKNGLILKLKNGLYVTKTYVDRSMHDPAYLELVANKLVIPSYLSLEYVLQKHNLLTEATFVFTSVTPKTTRRCMNKLCTFYYHSVKPDLYFGFEAKHYGKNSIYEASPAKALFDYLYLRTTHLDSEREIAELRINWTCIEEKQRKLFCDIVKKSGIKKMISFLPKLEGLIHGHVIG